MGGGSKQSQQSGFYHQPNLPVGAYPMPFGIPPYQQERMGAMGYVPPMMQTNPNQQSQLNQQQSQQQGQPQTQQQSQQQSHQNQGEQNRGQKGGNQQNQGYPMRGFRQFVQPEGNYGMAPMAPMGMYQSYFARGQGAIGQQQRVIGQQQRMAGQQGIRQHHSAGGVRGVGAVGQQRNTNSAPGSTGNSANRNNQTSNEQ